jgi:hypothetical protein
MVDLHGISFRVKSHYRPFRPPRLWEFDDRLLIVASTIEDSVNPSARLPTT